MVGVRTSNRCETCRIRKKKCDEKRPSCTACTISGWKCPGYPTNKQLKFVNESSKVAKQYASRNLVNDEEPLNDSDVAFLESKESERHEGMKNWRWRQMQVKPLVPKHVDPNPLGTALIFCLDCKVDGVLVPLRLSGSHFEFIPARIGHSTALDGAVACLSAIYCCARQNPLNGDKEVWEKYVKALASLRESVNDAALRLASETLCASILLHMCEVFVSTVRGDWWSLAQGTSLLLSSRGVEGYTSEFEMAMLESQLPYIFGQSLKAKEPCFFSTPDWQDLLLRGPEWPFRKRQNVSLTLRTQIIARLADAPSLFLFLASMNEDEMYLPGRREQTEMLIAKARTMLDEIKQCLVLEAEPHFLTYSSPSNVLQEHINYPDMMFGILDCVSNSMLVTIDKILRSLCHARMVANIVMGENLEETEVFDDLAVIAGWRERAISAFTYVEGQSKFSAKMLGFGVQQIRNAASGRPVQKEYPVGTSCFLSDTAR